MTSPRGEQGSGAAWTRTAAAEWRRFGLTVIPEYELAEEPIEQAGGVFGIDVLKLRWPA